MPTELGVLHTQRQDKRTALPNILRRQFHASGQQIAVVTKLPDSIRQPCAKSADVTASLRCGNQVDVALGEHLSIILKPTDRPIQLLFLLRNVAYERRIRHPLRGSDLGREVIRQTILVLPSLVVTLGILVLEIDPKTGTQHCLRSQKTLQPRYGNSGGIKKCGIWPELHHGPGVACADLPNGLERRYRHTVTKGHLVLLPATLDTHLKLFGKRVYNGYPHTVQTTRIGIGLVRKLSPGMQPRENHLHRADFLSLVPIDRHSPAVIRNRYGAIFMQGD